MPTAHNEAKKEDISKTVIMPGDPLRAKYIAEKYLTDYKLVNKVRGMYAYTGYYKNKRVTVMAHGMGNPSVGIYTYELFKFYDVDEIIRIGSCGATTDKIKLRDVILVNSSYSDSNYAKYQSGSDKVILSSNKELNDKIKEASHNMNIRLLDGIVYSTDVFYSDVVKPSTLYNEYGCIAVEMETFALFHNANIFNKKASSILTVSDNIVTKEELPSMDRQTSFDDMILLALESIL